MGYHFLLQEIFPTQELNLGLPHCRQMLYCLSHQGSTYARGIAIPQSGLLSQGSSLRLPSGHSGLVLTLSNAARASLFSPRLLVADARVWATSLLGVAVRHIICGFIYLFFLPVMLPSEIPKLPTDPLVRGFLGVWKLFLFYDSLPGMDLRP